MTDDSPNTPETPSEGERIAKVIARVGLASRRVAERMVLDGRVKVNGQIITSPALDVMPADKVMVDGKPLDAPQETRLWMYYKPAGLVTSEADEKGRRTVFDELPDDLPRVMSVGRLDLNSEGLLLLTNDGELKRRLELPSTGWLRRYRVRVNGRPTPLSFDPLRRGVTIDGEDFQPMEVNLDSQRGDNAWLTVGIREGRNREIRRAMTHIGLVVNRLIRISYGPFRLTGMDEGEVREVRRRLLRDQLGPLFPGNEAAEDGASGNRAGGGKGRPDRGPRKPFANRDGGERKPYTPRDGADHKPYGTRPDGERKPYTPRDGGDRKPYGARPDGERKPYTPRDGADRKPYGTRPDGERKPYTPREDGERSRKPRHKAGQPQTGRSDFASRPENRAEARSGDYEKRPDRKPGGFKPRTEGGYRPRGEDGGAGKPGGFKPRTGGKPGGFRQREDGGRSEGARPDRKPGGFKPRGDGAPGSTPRGEHKSYAPRDGARKPYGTRPDGERKPGGFKPRGEGASQGAPRGDRKPGGFKPRTDGGYRPRGEDGGAGKPGGFKPRGDAKPGGFKPRGPRPGGKPPRQG